MIKDKLPSFYTRFSYYQLTRVLYIKKYKGDFTYKENSFFLFYLKCFVEGFSAFESKEARGKEVGDTSRKKMWRKKQTTISLRGHLLY